MLLRSSSTPMLASFHEAAGNIEKPSKTPSAPKNRPKLPIPSDPKQAMHIRRTRSAELINTKTLYEESAHESQVEFQAMQPCKNKFKTIPKLNAIPSSSLCRNNGKEGEEEDDENACHGEEFSFPEMGFHDIGRFGLFSGILNGNGIFDSQSVLQNPSAMYMATGLGIGGVTTNIQVDKFGDEKMEQHLEKLVKENPCNSLILRNYAQYLYETKRDYKKAEEYYARAILAEPSDGEVLSEYARLRWESNRDEQVASSYFEHAIQLSPENSHVLGAYASFLWDNDSGEEEEEEEQQQNNLIPCQPCYINP